MGITVSPTVAQPFHQFGRGIAEMKRYRKGLVFGHILLNRAVTTVQGVAFGGRGQIDGGLDQGQFPLGRSQKTVGLFRLQGLRQGPGVGQADIFGGKADQAPGNEQRDRKSVV